MNNLAFENGSAVQTIGFTPEAHDAYYFDENKDALDAEELLSAFCRAFDWIAQVPANDFKGMAIRVQVVRCILLKKDQVAMAKEIGVTKAAISQRMCDLRDVFKLRNPKSGLRSNETRNKFSEQCKSRHEKKKANSSNSGNSPTPSTTNSGKVIPLPSMPSKQVEPLSKRLFAQASS
jgi:hypothetical protein